MMKLATSKDKATAKDWKAVVLYGDAQSGFNAQKLLSRIARETQSGNSWQTNLWRFDVMSNRPVSDLALKDAQDAQLLFLSPGSVTQPPRWLPGWLRAWARKRRGKASAVAAWCQHPPDGEAREAIELLRQITLEQDMTFLCANDYTAEMGE